MDLPAEALPPRRGATDATVPPWGEGRSAESGGEALGGPGGAWADPLARSLAQPPGLALPGASPTSVAPPRELPPAVELALTRLVRRVAWGGDARRSGAAIEIGAGPLAGVRVAVSVGSQGVRVEIDGAGAEGDPLGQRIAARLEAAGVTVAAVNVR